MGALKGRKLNVTVSAAGTLDLTDAAQAGGGSAASRRLKPSSAAGGPGGIEVALVLTKAANQRLRTKCKLTVNARITQTVKLKRG